MGIRDNDNEYSRGQALTASAVSSDHINHRQQGRQPPRGTPMGVMITVKVAPDAAQGDETYTAKVEVDDASAFGSATQVGPTATIPRTAKAGDQFVIPLPPDGTFEKFSRVSYTLGGTTPTITVDAAFLPMWAIPQEAVYADNRTIA